MKTRITDLFGIEYPLVLPGMTYISVPELVAAVSNAGGLGIMASGGMGKEECRAAIRRIRELTSKPFGVGASLMMPGAKECAEVALEEQVPVINFSLGKGDWIAQRAHAYGGKVIATVVTEKHARSAAKMGVDALLVTGHEAAAHGGEVTTLVLVPAIRDAVDLPIIAAGGFADGRGLMAALSLGADAIALGTRLASSRESPLHDNTKQMIVAKHVDETLYTKNFDGLPCRVMKTPTSARLTARPLGVFAALWRSLGVARELKTPMLKLFRDLATQGVKATLQIAYLGAASLAIKKAIVYGDHERGVQLIGQAQGLVHDVPSVAELFAKVMTQAEAVRQTLRGA
ncbi:MAG TPA: nitronate monooxygenase [Polyangiales bacterium]